MKKICTLGSLKFCVRERKTEKECGGWRKQVTILFLFVSQIRVSITMSQIALGHCQKRLMQK